MISAKSVRAIHQAKALLASRRGAAALEMLGRLEPCEHEAAPILTLRVEALLADKREIEAEDLARDLWEEVHVHPMQVGAACGIVFSVLASHYAKTGRLERAREFAASAEQLSAIPGDDALSDPVERSLWVEIFRAHNRAA